MKIDGDDEEERRLNDMTTTKKKNEQDEDNERSSPSSSSQQFGLVDAMLRFGAAPQPFRVAIFRFGAVFGRRSTAFRSSRVDAMLCFSGSAFPS